MVDQNKYCPITYEPISELSTYSEAGLNLLSPKLTHLQPLSMTTQDLLKEAKQRADKLSIQGVQPKLSALLDISQEQFKLVDIGGTFILKPQHMLYEQLPENEALTMSLAQIAGVPVPIHGLVYTSDHQFVYFIKRFDRKGKTKKIAVEDFAQLSGSNRHTKYNYSMEKLIAIIDTYTTFPVLEKADLILRVLVNYLLGNEDMHLKNYSLIHFEGKTTLAPAYDFVNSSIVLSKVKEEIALPLNGKKTNLTPKDLINYYGSERLQLPQKIIAQKVEQILKSLQKWHELINISFLNDHMKSRYRNLLNARLKRLGWM